MEGKGHRFSARQIPSDSPDYEAALHVALGVSPSADGSSARQVASLRAAAHRQTLSLELVFGAFLGNRLVGACVALEPPGAAALVYVNPDQPDGPGRDATLTALWALQQAAWTRSIKLLEVLVDPAASNSASLVRDAGFTYVTELLYLQRQCPGREWSAPGDPDLCWVGYSDVQAQVFRRALEATYIQSLDCPELTGIRSTGEILAGHKATGIFDPSLWWVATRQGIPVGVLLLNRVTSQPALEVVYIGVSQPARGTGVADALLARAVTLTERENARYLTLAVDVRNAPARRMYRRWSFRQVGVRAAWIASSPGT